MTSEPTIGAREVARDVLRRVRREDAYATLALDAALRRHDLPPAERGLATELVYGVLRHRRRLDHAVGRHAARGLGRVDDDVLDLLRLAAYQILLLDRVPAHAAVDHAVGAVRGLRGQEVAGFANAVLRKLTARDLTLDLPRDPVQRLALEGSLPDPLARAWAEQIGQEQAEQLARALLERAPITLRVNTLKGDTVTLQARLEAEGASVGPGRWLGPALRVVSARGLFQLPSHRDGLWSVQDEAAQLAALALDPRPGETVLDACAGVGGKSMQLAALMQDRGKVICVDVSARKLELLEAHGVRLGVSCCEIRPGDLRQMAPCTVDRALVDAPCTGLGVLRRHPELKWRSGAGLDALARLVPLQRELLEAAVSGLRPGGVLVYGVCTTTAEEGEEQLAWLRGRHPDLAPDPIPDAVPRALLGGALRAGPANATSEPLVHDGGLPVNGAPPTGRRAPGVLRLWPHLHDTDGFFIARLRRMQ